jgi:hypothetical protein
VHPYVIYFKNFQMAHLPVVSSGARETNLGYKLLIIYSNRLHRCARIWASRTGRASACSSRPLARRCASFRHRRANASGPFFPLLPTRSDPLPEDALPSVTQPSQDGTKDNKNKCSVLELQCSLSFSCVQGNPFTNHTGFLSCPSRSCTCPQSINLLLFAHSLTPPRQTHQASACESPKKGLLSRSSSNVLACTSRAFIARLDRREAVHRKRGSWDAWRRGGGRA